jgi:hypothetical protein
MEQSPQGGEHQHAPSGESRHHGFFQFGPWVFNVDRALALIFEKQQPTRHVLPVEAWACFYGLAEMDNENTIPMISPGPGFDRDYAMTTDLSMPVVVATLRGQDGRESPLLIDGCHRLYRAYAEGVPQLPAYLLDYDESMAIRDGLFLR